MPRRAPSSQWHLFPHRAVALLVATAVLAGCGTGGFFLDNLFPEQIKRMYKLDKNQRTVVIVDDPHGQMGNPILLAVIAERTGFDLTDKGLVKKGNMVPVREVQALAATLGKDYATTPLDAVARRLGARQVIHVDVESAGLDVDPGILQPRAAVAIKVFDAEQGKRLFPALSAASDIEDFDASFRGHVLTVEMRHMIQTEFTPGERALTMQDLADRIGQEVAGVFYSHAKFTPGDIRR